MFSERLFGSMETLRIPSANAKLRRLCTESAVRGGRLMSFSAVAMAIGITPGRFSQLFGVSAPAAEQSISPETLGRIIAAFNAESIPVDVAGFTGSYEQFAERLMPDQPLLTQGDGVVDETMESDNGVPSADWRVAQSSSYTEIAALHAHPPRPMNSRPDCYLMDVTLRFEPVEYVLDDKRLLIGLRQANLSISSNAYQIAHNSLIGDSARPLDGVSTTITGISVQSSGHSDFLTGSPLLDHAFAVIEPAGTGEPTISLTLQAAPRNFTFEMIDDDGEVCTSQRNPTKDALLALVFGESLQDTKVDINGRLTLAKATLRRRDAR